MPWQGHLFVGALNGQTLQRVAFDQPAPQAERRDSLFMSLGRRWRQVVQSPDGYLYAVTEKRTLGTPPDPNDATSGVVYPSSRPMIRRGRASALPVEYRARRRL